MKVQNFEGAKIRAAGLFSTGPGGRHDWMRFHADEVPCPLEVKSLPCTGNLKWLTKGKELRCDHCKVVFLLSRKKK